MVRVEKDYVFEGEAGQARFVDLFGDHQQLIVYHFMFDADWEVGCPGCTAWVNALGDMSTLSERGTALVLASRAPLRRLLAYKSSRGWTWPWYSTENSDFNFDYGVRLDPSRGEVTYNYKDPLETEVAIGKVQKPTEMPGLSVFFRLGGDVFHTYSTYARGGEALVDSYRLLDVTPFGRQEDFEDSPEGWPQRPTYG